MLRLSRGESVVDSLTLLLALGGSWVALLILLLWIRWMRGA